MNFRVLFSSPPLTGLIVMLTVIAGYMAANGTSISAQEAPWPTPPPGVPFTPPLLQDPVEVSAALPGSSTLVVFPQWPGQIPLVPPVPQTTLVFESTNEHPPITLVVDAGTADHTLQIRYTPLAVEDLPAASQGRTLLRAFLLEPFDALAEPVSTAFARPMKLTIPVATLTGAGIQGDRLLVALLDAEEGLWRPLITTYYPGTNTLEVRLIAFDTIALLQE
ncbi:MAG: hypothetical protein O2812_00985 [Chloroflexi bacterium]|nr:hypothetical protein [Chloroflexota bacterium]